MEDKIDKKLMTRLAKEGLAAGKTKQQVYDELVAEYKWSNDIAAVVANIPTPARLKKYGVYNTVYLVFLVLFMVIMLFSPNLGLVWLAWLIFFVYNKNFKMYYWNTVLGVILLITAIALAVFDNTPAADRTSPKVPVIIASIILSAIFILAGTYLPKLLTPDYREVKEPYVNSEGEEKIRVKHVFPE